MRRQRACMTMVLVATMLLVAGCAGSSRHMKEIAAGEVNIAPGGRQASVVFMRPSGLGFAINSSVFDIEGDANHFVGILSAKKKVVYKTKPGPHMFMVIGESADFMQADLRPGKIYYALVTPRIGAWKARFSLKPVSRKELGTADFKDWSDSCTYTENTDSSFKWAEENAASVQAKKTEYMPRWQGKAEAARPFLGPDDCQ